MIRTHLTHLTHLTAALAAGALLAGCRSATDAVPRGGPAVAVDALQRDIAYLASDALEGRGTGTPGADSAAAYIARRYAALALDAPFPDPRCGPAVGCERVYLQPFSATSALAAHHGAEGPLATHNVAAIVRGSDPALRDEYVVVGAHFDHLGRSPLYALDPGARDAIRNGADDNASGTAAVLELARLLARQPPRRSVIVANFGAEELGLLGARYLVEHFPVPLERVVGMLNFDMVGRLRDDRLLVYGTGTARELLLLLDSAAAGARLDVKAIADGHGPSDHSVFYQKGIPVLHFFTDLHGDYHRATDDVEKINLDGLARVVALAERVTRRLADRDERPTFTAVAAPAPTAGRGYGPYLGTIPDMGATDVRGVRLTGVRDGSPAAAAGLREGDVIVRFGERAVTNLYDYTDALRAHDAGDVVPIVVLRGAERLTLTATLGRRQ